jgi:hypothetical protein
MPAPMFPPSHGDPLLAKSLFHTSLTLTMTGKKLSDFFKARIAKATERKTEALAAVSADNERMRVDNAKIIETGRANAEKEMKPELRDNVEYKQAYDAAVEEIVNEYGPENTDRRCKERLERVAFYFDRAIEEMTLLSENMDDDAVSYLSPSELLPYYDAERMDIMSDLGRVGRLSERLGSASRAMKRASDSFSSLSETRSGIGSLAKLAGG